MNTKLSLALGMALLTTFSCQSGSKGDGSSVKIVDGTEVSQSSYPHCVLLIQGNFGCTATFLNDTTVLTAGHCVDHKDSTGGVEVMVNGSRVHSQNVFVSPGYDMYNDGNPRNIRMYDIAVVVFPEGTGTSLGITNYPRLASHSPRVGDRVTLMGYGRTTFVKDVNDAGTLRRGTSGRITAISAENYQIDGVKGSSSWVGPGDSGGAQYNAAGEILGVVSQGVVATYNGGFGTNNFKNVVGPNAMDVFNRAVNCSSGPCATEFRPGYIGGTNPPQTHTGTSLGISGGSVPDTTGRIFVVIQSVVAGGAAANAGIRAGDVIWSINGTAVQSMATVVQILKSANGVANIVVYRNGQPLTFNGIELQ